MNFPVHLQTLMNVRQLKLGTVNTDVEIHWAHTNATVMKDIHCKRINAKVSMITCQLSLPDSLLSNAHLINFRAFNHARESIVGIYILLNLLGSMSMSISFQSSFHYVSVRHVRCQQNLFIFTVGFHHILPHFCYFECDCT